jgi:hypothetical protein
MKIDLDSAKEQLERRDYIQPYRHTFWIEYLMPVGMEPPSKLEVLNLANFFIQESSDDVDYKSAIIHGHREKDYCAAPKMCHLYGFWPTKEMSPRFKKIFEARWKPAYAVLKWEIPT